MHPKLIILQIISYNKYKSETMDIFYKVTLLLLYTITLKIAQSLSKRIWVEVQFPLQKAPQIP